MGPASQAHELKRQLGRPWSSDQSGPQFPHGYKGANIFSARKCLTMVLDYFLFLKLPSKPMLIFLTPKSYLSWLDLPVLS